MDPRIQSLIDWVKTSASPAGGLLVPVSGGSDSALCFWICRQAYPDKAIAVFFGDNLRSREWFASVGEVRMLPEPAAEDNREVQRWARSLAVALTEKRWLVGTRNRTEDALGTYSLASRLATYLPLAGTWKSDVMELCKIIGVPDEITSSSRKADPDCGRPAELAEIPLELIDTFLKVKVGTVAAEAISALSEEQVRYLDGLHKANQFKQHLPTKPNLL
jgi:NH3-dependent NAD+ synthetase